MTGRIKVLVVDDVATTRENIIKLMQFHSDIEAVGQAANGEEALLQARLLKPDVVLMDINMPGMDGITAAERLTVESPQSTVIIMSVQGEQEYLRRAMVAGAKNYLTKPFTGDELIQAIRQSVERDRKVRQAVMTAGGEKKAGKVIAVFSGKGGVGKTTITVNLALALTQRSAARVAIVDADVQFGDVSLFMNVIPRSSLADLMADGENLDGKTLLTYMTQYPGSPSIQILAAPVRPEQAEVVSGAVVAKSLNILRNLFDFILVDTTDAFSEMNIAILDVSDQVLLISAPDLPSIKNTKMILEVLQSLGYPDEKIRLIVNRQHSEGGIVVREIEEALKREVAFTVPADVKVVVNSINKGQPFVLSAPDSEISKTIKMVIDHLLPAIPDERALDPKPKRRFKLFGK